MCEATPNLKAMCAALEADDRDALRDFARKRRDRSQLQRHRDFWQSVVTACQHPRGAMLADDFKGPVFEGTISMSTGDIPKP